MRKRRNDYKSINPDPKIIRDEINHNRIVENHKLVDYSVFVKTDSEKARLKELKRLAKRK